MVGRQIHTDLSRIHVWNGDEGLDPVRFSVASGAFHFQDYLTPALARELAGFLLAAALEAETLGAH